MTSFHQIQDADIDIDVISSKPTPGSPVHDSNQEEEEPAKINTTALNGLRGILAVHIMVNHSFEFSKLQLSLLASVDMPLFFLISGFIFALNDGSKKQYSKTKCCTELRKFTATDEQNRKFNAKDFYLRRIARTLPLYYLTSFLCEPLVYSGYSSLVSPGILNYIAIALTLTCTGSWFGPFLLNLPAWFVSTIWFYYWCFPSLIPKLQRYSIRALRCNLVLHNVLQILIAVGLFVPLKYFMSGTVSDFAFNVATMWPPSRFPVFIMGILAGLLRNKSIVIREQCNEYNANDWSRMCNILWLTMCVVMTCGVVVEWFFHGVTNLNFWLQIVLVWIQMEFIYALSMDNGQSITSRLLTGRFVLFCGRISYSLYLIHFPLIGYMCWMVNGFKVNTMPSCSYDSDDAQCKHEWTVFNDNRLLPLWCIPIHCAVSFLLAVLLNRYFEQPMRKWLRPRNAAKNALPMNAR